MDGKSRRMTNLHQVQKKIQQNKIIPANNMKQS